MRTYKDIEVKYYDTKGDVHVRCSVPVTEDALVHFELMQSHYCKLSFKLGSAIYFKIGDFIVTDYGRFVLVDNVKPKDDGTLGYSYELEFDAYYRKWKNKRLKYMPNSGSPEGTFTLTSNIITHANIIKDNLDFLAKASKSYLYDPNYTGKGSDYTFVVDASVDSTKSKVITYSNSSILDAIANIAQTFECEWWVEGNLVHFGTCENTNEVVDFKDGENIVSMSSSQSQASYANRVYAFGAARNLPSGYKQNSSADVTKNGVVEKRLMLPTLEECSAENKKLLEDNGFELKNGCLQVKGLTEDEYVEGVTTNDDIYPRNLIKTSNVTYYEKDVEDESTPEEGDYIKRTFYRVKGLTIVDADGNKTGDMAFRSSYILSGKTLHIIFQSGSLNGMDFECQFNPDGESEILRDSNGSPILKDGKEQINPAAQVFEIVANEDYGRFLPDTVLHPKDGDTFVLYNWDSTKLGNTLVTSSSNELLTDAIKNLKKSMIDPTTYTCTAASDYSYNDGKGQFHFEGDRVNLFNKGYDMSFRASRIIGYELHLDVPFDSVKYTVGEKPAYSRLNAMSSQIEELVFNGQSYLNKGGSGNSIYIIKSYDTTVQPTDFNVFSAKRVENSYLHKDKTDAANFLIKFLRGLQVGDYSALSGGDWSLDELFRSHLTTDYLNVRMKAIFETLEILHTDTLGGELFITTVGSNRILKVEEVNVTYDGVSQNAYRCYFLGEQDGSKVENKWKVGDQARSKSFNLTQGKFHNVGNHYYWRLVIGVSTETVEIEGKNYHYVDLSDIDKDTSSDIPMVDDVLNQVGSRIDNARQSCLVFSAVDTYSPSVTLYHGVNGYTFNNKEYVDYGVNHSTGKAFFHVYGDMYFGDRPTSANNYEGESYVKFDSETKKVTIKGDLDIKSTYDGKTLDKYIADKSLDKDAVETIIKKSQTIIDLQNQIDGAIETWFYDGVPTLKNAPAISWKTDKDKETHLGDLYYDNKTGKAYRFAKDGSTYEWIIITDTELTKALKDSSQALKDAAAADKKANGAQATANTKRRIFGSQPVPPYDVNDMWVNATYPSDGSTYKNEILKCSTSKAEGEEFDIADWKLASKYTDDTKAEEAKKAAEKAQEEIKNTQTNLITLGTTVSNNKKAFDVFTSDGYLDSSEIAAIAQDSKRLEDDYNAAVESYNNVVGSKFLLDKDGKETTYKTDLVSAKDTLDSAKNELITYLSDIVSRYNASDSKGKATIKVAAAQKYTNFTNAYKAFYDKLGVANNYITSNLFDGLNTKLITNMAGLEYIKAALVDGIKTEIKGGLVLTTLIALRNEKGDVTSGINGANVKDDGIALWLGGKAIDRQASTTKEDEMDSAAKALLRFDGTGYFANGNLWWDADGTLHADPTSFIINKNNVGVQLALFAPVWKSGTTDTTKLANVLAIDPQKPFTHLDVSGNVTTEGSLKIGGIYLSYDSANNALRLSKDAAGKEAANFYALGGITAYGAGASTTGGGGGLNGSVKSYSNALKLTSESLSEIASAYSIKALDSRISSLEGGSAMDVSVSGSGNAVTAISKSGTTIIVTKGTTFLTSHQSLASYLTKTDAASLYQPKGNYLTAHQSLDGYVNAIAVSGSGNAVTAVTKSGKTITFTKGSTFSLNGHTHTFASLTSKPTSLSGYGITDGVNAVSVTGSGNAITTASISGHTLTLTKGSSFSLSNHTHYVGTTQVQGSSAEQALTGITKIDNILKLSKASVTVNTSYKAEQNRLVIYGTTYGNDANYIKSAGKLSYGDGGPQLVFSTSDNPDASGVQSAALVYTDHDTIGAGVSLSFVTNQGDAYFIAPHIKALTAFQGNLAWSYITNKPTTLSGFGITDGLRSVTQPSGSNVFVTGISTSGTAITYTKSYTKKSLSAVGTSGWTNASIDGNIIPDMSFIAYWNGAYSGTSSNLAYCNKGAFGSFAIKNSLAFSELTSKPTTISGYGITDAYTKSQVDTIAAKYLPLTGGTLTGQLKIEASALNGAYNGLRIGDDCYIGDCNFGNTIGLMGVGNNNAGMVKFGKGGMQFGYNGSNHIASTTAQWTNLNADLLDGWHKDNIVWSGAVNSNTASLSHYWAKLFDITVTSNQYDDRSFTFLFSNGFNDTYSVVVLRIRQNGAKDSGAYNFIISLRELVGNMSSRLRVYYNNATGNVQLWGNCQRQYGSLSYTIIKKTGRTSADFKSQGTLVTNTSFSAAQSLPATTGDSPYTLLDGATRIGIVNQADQLVTARTIWGQSFNGTANVSGALSGATTISASNTISTTLQNGALKIGNKLTPISAIDAQVIFNTGAAIRFGETNWDWNQWAGLKYTHSNKTIYLGIADNSVFNANSAQSNGTLKFPGITTITPDGGARIGGSGGDLYLGNANNSGFVKVQDMCSQVNSSYWNITQLGSATFKSLTVNNVINCDSISVSKNAVIAGNLSVNGLINNKGILPTNYEVNNKGAGCYVSADALCSGITAITDSISVDNLSIVYSNDNGTNWTNYNVSNDTKFKAYANVAGVDGLSLGGNVITGNNDAEKLAQIKKNQLMFTFYVPNNCYSQVYFACVDMGQGVGVTCTVEYLNSKGVIVNTYIKYMTGWNQFNYINLSNGNTAVGVGNDDRRYIRFRFKHDQNTTALRNASINKIRIFAFTKYSFPTDRFMGHTGHIYNFDYNMNTYFPNSILAKGGVTAYQSSDIRLKQDLRKLDYLGIIKAMGGTYGFAWKKDNTRSIGWIAQHVLHNPQLKDIVETDEKGYYKINYWSPKLIATAFGAIEQVGDEVSRLKARVVFLESEVLRLSGDKEDCNKKRLDNKNINLLN